MEDHEQVRESRQEKAFDAMTVILESMMEEHGEIYIYEMGMMLYSLLFRMRQAFTFEETVSYLTGLLNLTEQAVRLAKQEHGDSILLAEDWRYEGGEEMRQALSDLTRTDDLTIPEDWLTQQEEE